MYRSQGQCVCVWGGGAWRSRERLLLFFLECHSVYMVIRKLWQRVGKQAELDPLEQEEFIPHP